MFNNIIYFIIVLLTYSINFPDSTHRHSLAFFLIMLLLSWFLFAGYCSFRFRSLQKSFNHGTVNKDLLAVRYRKLVSRLSLLAIIFFGLAVYLFDLKYWVELIPGFERFSLLGDSCAISLFIFYLITIWYLAYPAYCLIFQPLFTKWSYILSNFRLNIPILFPWIIFSLVYDVISLSPWPGLNNFVNTIQGQIISFICLITILMLFLPKLILSFWGCKPLDNLEKGRQLKTFLKEKGFKYRQLLLWPIFEGEMMTAGIMGITGRYRYILFTNSILNILSIRELKGVLAHEMGHARYRHQLLFILFFIGFFVLSLELFDLYFYLIFFNPLFISMGYSNDSQSLNLLYLLFSVPVLISIFIYFRYLMGFFMRNFERQADLYSAAVMGTPEPVISSLEKIAFYSGKTRDVPSWHHFSIRQRVDFLRRTANEPKLSKKHNRFVWKSLLIYIGCLIISGCFLDFSPMKENLLYSLVGKTISRQLINDPENTDLYMDLAIVYNYLDKHKDEIEIYEKIIALKPDHADALNNLAWLLITSPDKKLKNEKRALVLAKRAVAIKRNSMFLDTLAEACFENGLTDEAIRNIKEAISLATDNRDYYINQLQKFQSR